MQSRNIEFYCVTYKGHDNFKECSWKHRFVNSKQQLLNSYRNPAVWINKGAHLGFKTIHIVSSVSGNANYSKDYKFSLGKQYDITIQQSKQNGKYWYEIWINGHLKFKVQNTKPRSFSNVKEYISDPWHPHFSSDLGTVSNLEIEQ